MFERFYYHHFGIEYVVVDAWEFRGSKRPGDERLQCVMGIEARGVIESMAREDPDLFERVCRASDDDGSPRHRYRAYDDWRHNLRIERILRALGVDPPQASPGAVPSAARLVLLRPGYRARPESTSESPENLRIRTLLAQQVRGETLIVRGEHYQLALGNAGTSARHREMFETLSEEQLLSVLRELIAAPATPSAKKPVFAELLSLAETQRTKKGSTNLLLLQRPRSYARPDFDRGPSITPSQLRSARENHWVEILLEDKRLGPLGGEALDITLPDGRRQCVATNEQGSYRVDTIPAGSCRIQFRPTQGHPPKNADVEWSKLELGVTVGGDEQHRFVVDHNRAEIVEIDDGQFCADSSILAPRDVAQGGIHGLSMLAHALRYASDNPNRRLMIVGHADQQEGDRASLASARAKVIAALLQGDAKAFAAACVDPNQAATPRLLAWAHEHHRYECDPATAIANGADAKRGKADPVQAALLRFREAHNQREKTQLAESAQGMAGADYEAFFTLFERSLADLLDVRASELSNVRSKLKFHGVATLAAETEWARPAGAGGKELRSRSARRVDLMFLESDRPIPSIDATAASAEHFYVDERRVRRAYLPPQVSIVVVTPYAAADIDSGSDAEFKLEGPGYSRAIKVSDQRDHAGDFFDVKYVELQFHGVPAGGAYKLTTTPKGGAASVLFEGVPFEELLGANGGVE